MLKTQGGSSMIKNSNSKIRLNNGVEIPPIGFGVFRMENLEECEKATIEAIKAGYRLIDTAAAYKNEEAVGRAIKNCGIPREELFITTKLWITDTSYEGAKRGFEKSLSKLGLDYLDLYLIHQPYNDYYGAWRALEELYEEGKVRAIGIDNFTQDRTADFIFFNKIKPMINLVECNTFFQREDEKKYLDSENILMQAWSPLAAGQSRLFENETLLQIAHNHNKTVAQIVLRWLVQRGIVPIVKSSNPVRMKENLDIFDFEISQYEMEEIEKLDTGRTCFIPRNTGEIVKDFLEHAMEYNV